MDLVGKFRVGERVAVVLAGILTVMFIGVLIQCFWPPEDLNETAPSFRQDLPEDHLYTNGGGGLDGNLSGCVDYR